MTRPRDESFNPIALLLACILPGLGHAWLGDYRRGLAIATGVLGLFFGGMLIGGIDVIDRAEDKWWFVLQAGVGPTAFAIDAIHQNHFKIPAGRGTIRVTPNPDPTENPGGIPAKNVKSIGRVNEVGSLYAAMAGMLNMIAIIDAALRAPFPSRRRRDGDPA